MKKWTLLLLTAIIVLSFIAFGTSTEGTNRETTPNTSVNFERHDHMTVAPETQTVPTVNEKPQQDQPTNSTSVIASGICTDTITWVLTSDGTLTLSGMGAITDYEKGATNQPWREYRRSITALVIKDGITRIGDRAFQSCAYIVSASIGNDVDSIGQWAFQNCYALTDVDLSPNTVLETGAFRSTPVEWSVSAIGSTLYTGSSYSVALSQVVLTGDHREDIINIALSQVGYHGGRL